MEVVHTRARHAHIGRVGVGTARRGWNHEQILAGYPHLAEEDILACLALASELPREAKVYPLKTA